MGDRVERTPTTEPLRSARELLVDWASQQDAWLRSIVGEVVSARRALPSTSVEAARDRYLAEKQLADGEAQPAPETLVRGEDDRRAEALRLISLRECRGVNALAEGQDVTFHPRLTVLFGENATGKSGYVRVLKRLANVRSAEAIIPDIHRLSAPAQPSAIARYAIGDSEQEVVWQGESGLAPFTRMTVFDSPAVALHLEGSVTYVFTPADLALFRYTHAAVEGVRALLEEEAARRDVRQNPFLTAFARGTPVYADIEALSASTNLARLGELAAISAAERAELDTLRTSQEALASGSPAGRREMLKTRSTVLQHLTTLAGAVEAFEPPAYDEAIRVDAQARDAHVADAVYADGQLPTGIRPAWQAFLEAGERYTVASRSTEYPGTDDVCIYCGQELGQAAHELVLAYRHYASGATAAAVDASRRQLAGLAAPLASPAVATALEALRAMLPGLEEGDDHPEWVGAGRDLFERTTVVRDAVLSDRPISPSPEAEVVARALRPQLGAAAAETKEALAALEGDAVKREHTLAKNRSRIADLEARQTLARLLPEIQTFVEQATWVHRLRTLLARFPGLLRSLTEVSKLASQEVLNRDFERVFNQECTALRAPNVTLDFPGRRGESSRRKTVAADHTLAEILSQGEQKVIAIADFLAEASLRSASAPIVFDDPVDSFDHRRVGEIAARIADLSDDQQVIVFTHDIMFAASLLSHFEDRPSECAFYQVTEDQGHKGIVSKATHPRLDSMSSIRGRINEGIQTAQAAEAAERQELIDAIYDHIRAWCEVVVETKLLAKVTQRYKPNVAMQQLERIKVERLEAAVAAILPIWEKANRYTPAHSQPLVTLGVRPTLDELRVDWARLQQALKDYEAG